MLITFGDDNDHNDSEALHGRNFTEMNILQNSLDRDVGGSVVKEKVWNDTEMKHLSYWLI